jgi:5'(3')-deoxyribonucleotidase
VAMFLDYVQRLYGTTHTREQITDWDCMAAVGLPPEEWRRMAHNVAPLELCRRMPVLPGAVGFLPAIERLVGADNVKIATSPMCPAWLSQRAEWLEEFGVPLRRQKHLHEKEALAGAYDILIDDHAENCEKFQEAGGLAFCIAAPYNAGARVPRGTHAQCLAWLAALRDYSCCPDARREYALAALEHELTGR